MLYSPIKNNIINSMDINSELRNKSVDYKGYFVNFRSRNIIDILTNIKEPEYVFRFSTYQLDFNDIKIKNTNTIHYIKDLSELEDEESILKSMDSKKRNQVRKALKSEHETVIETLDTSNLDQIYQVYKESMKRLGTIPKSRNHFENLSKTDCSVISLKNREGKYLAVNIILKAYPYSLLMFNLSNAEYWIENVNDRIYYETIKFLAQEKFSLIDFGPSM